MIERLDSELEALLRRQMPSGELDISFAWPGSLTQSAIRRPTINLFLWDAGVNSKMGSAGPQSRTNSDRSVSHKLPDPYIDVRYLTTLWCDRERDEHRLLGQLLALVLASKQIEIVHRDGEPARPATLHLERPETRRLDAVWQGMQGRLRPAVDLVVTTTIDVFGWEDAAAPVAEVAASAVPLPGGRALPGHSQRSVEYLGHTTGRGQP